MSDAVNKVVLAELKELLEDGFPLLVERFVDDGEARIAKMDNAIASNDAQALYGEAHGLKGSSRNVGAAELAEQCAMLEHMGHQENLTDAAETFASVKAEFDRACAELKSFSC